jgi:hypothetical protein
MPELPRPLATLHLEALVGIGHDILPSLFGHIGWHAMIVRRRR